MNRLPDLTGKTVLVVGGAPCDVSAVVADYTIAASGGIKHVPDADMLIAIDNKMPPHAIGADAGFAGVRVTGVPSDHLYLPFPYESVTLKPGHTVHIRNNGLSAIRTAAECGAKYILLAGFDAAPYDTENAHLGYDAGILATALPALIAELSGRGVAVEHYAPPVKRGKRG